MAIKLRELKGFDGLMHARGGAIGRRNYFINIECFDIVLF
jgi:hypothetical protein